MELVGERHAYPLVAVWAQRFVSRRCALIGDAAVGMHPVTAHGYNLGLAGVESLTATLHAAQARGQDIGDAAVLARYERQHRLHAWPIYQGTNTVVGLYTDTRPLPKLLRRAVLAGSTRLPPLKALIVSQLTGRRPAWPTLPGRF
jgi:2-polyprenyl-6-methoxyphenol hydroxylase-like FAD-dependent oxidoreductase